MNRTPLPAMFFERIDSSPDALFYAGPRFVTHIDDATRAALTAYYASVLTAGADVLDLMSSWVSHLPPTPVLGRVAGLGMNAAELAANARLSDWVVHDLNDAPWLPYQPAQFDCVFIAVSVQYLIHPLQVFADIARVLRAGGVLAVSLSHRCFPTKAIRAFHSPRAEDRLRLASEYIERVAGFSAVRVLDRSPPGADPLWIVEARRATTL